MSDRLAILVTGGAGYVGAHACRALSAAGYQPIVYDNLSTGHREFVADPLVVGDLLDKARLAQVFADHQVAAVMHFAAASPVGESMIDPQKYYINNVVGTSLDVMCRLPSPGVFLHRCGLRLGRQQGAAGKLSLRADQSLWRIEMDDRAHTRGLSQRLRSGRILPALFQRLGRRCGRRDR